MGASFEMPLRSLKPKMRKNIMLCRVLVITLLLFFTCFIEVFTISLNYDKMSKDWHDLMALLLIACLVTGGLMISGYITVHLDLFRLWQENGTKIPLKYRCAFFFLPIAIIAETVLLTYFFPHIAVLCCSLFLPAAGCVYFIVRVFRKRIVGDFLYKPTKKKN